MRKNDVIKKKEGNVRRGLRRGDLNEMRSEVESLAELSHLLHQNGI